MIYEEGLKKLFIAWRNNDYESWLYKHSGDINTKGREELCKDGSRRAAVRKAQNNRNEVNEENGNNRKWVQWFVDSRVLSKKNPRAFCHFYFVKVRFWKYKSIPIKNRGME